MSHDRALDTVWPTYLGSILVSVEQKQVLNFISSFKHICLTEIRAKTTPWQGVEKKKNQNKNKNKNISSVFMCSIDVAQIFVTAYKLFTLISSAAAIFLHAFKRSCLAFSLTWHMLKVAAFHYSFVESIHALAVLIFSFSVFSMSAHRPYFGNAYNFATCNVFSLPLSELLVTILHSCAFHSSCSKYYHKRF